MKSLPHYARKLGTAASGWANRNRLAVVACAAFSVAGSTGTALHMINAAVPGDGTAAQNTAVRDQERSTLNTDIDQLVAAQNKADTLRIFQKRIQDTHGAATAPIDEAKLEADREDAVRTSYVREARMFDDFFLARHLSLNDMDKIRDRIRDEAHDSQYGITGGHLSEDIRKCQDKVMSAPGFKPSPETGSAILNCMYYDVPVTSEARWLTALLVLSSVGGLIASGLQVGLSLASRPPQSANLPAPQVLPKTAAALPAAAAAPAPLVLNAPTKISAPLKLRRAAKPSRANAPGAHA